MYSNLCPPTCGLSPLATRLTAASLRPSNEAASLADLYDTPVLTCKTALALGGFFLRLARILSPFSFQKSFPNRWFLFPIIDLLNFSLCTSDSCLFARPSAAHRIFSRVSAVCFLPLLVSPPSPPLEQLYSGDSSFMNSISDCVSSSNEEQFLRAWISKFSLPYFLIAALSLVQLLEAPQ